MHFADWGSLNYASNEAYLALKYYKITNNTEALIFGKSNIDFILGTHENTDNTIPENFSFVIGYNELNGSFPQYPQHAGAFGYGADAWDMFTQEEQNPGTVPYQHQISGALVGGPKTPCGEYIDNIGDYVSNEVCIYYNAGLINSLGLINSNTFIGNFETKPKISIYPNPTEDYITIETEMINYQVDIVDIRGKKHKTITVNGNNKIEISDLPPSIYFIKIYNNFKYFTTIKMSKI